MFCELRISFSRVWSAKIGVISVLNWFQWTSWGNFISRIRFIHLNSHKIMSITAVLHTRTQFKASLTSNLITFNWLLNYLLNLCFPPLATLNVNTARKDLHIVSQIMLLCLSLQTCQIAWYSLQISIMHFFFLAWRIHFFSFPRV